MKYIAFTLFSLLILAACAPTPSGPSEAKQIAEELKKQAEQQAAEPKIEQTIEQPIEKTLQTTDEPTPEPTPEPTEALKHTLAKDVLEETITPAQTRTKMYQFLDTFAKNVKSYSFKHKGNIYNVKGTRYKVILDSPVTLKHVYFGEMPVPLFYYDTVYVDRATKTATAFCEGHKSHVNAQCYGLKLYDLAYPVEFKNYDIILPEDWLLSNLDKEPNQVEANKYYVKGRASVFVRFETNPALELSIDPGTGLIMQADTKKGNQLLSRNEYLELVANKVRDVDVKHRSKEEIPTEEVFYR
ncbi:MAG: hypothetical protein QW165_00330 [Candidatus Woesearchaeota archaeon]